MDIGRVVVIGGGAAGMMAAIAASDDPNHEVHLIEQNMTLGRKLLITGGGRCNLTSALPMEDFQEKIVGNGKFLYSAFAAFSNETLMQWMQEQGVPLKREGLKVYPKSDQARSVLHALEKEIEKCVKLHLGEQALDLIIRETSEGKQVEGVVTNRNTWQADRVIVCTGGKSFSATGSDGRFFDVLTEYGVKIEKLYPSLVQMILCRPYADLKGLSVPNVRLSAQISNRRYESHGDLLFTHRGISGPAALDMSAYLTKENPQTIKLFADLLPRCSEEEIMDCLMQPNKKKIENKLAVLLPHRLLRRIYEDVREQVPSNMKKQDREQLIARVKSLSLPIAGFGSLEESIITKGGVSLGELRSSTLEHKKIRGLFFAGECLDIDALTGGYNLQVAFSTGYLAGRG